MLDDCVEHPYFVLAEQFSLFAGVMIVGPVVLIIAGVAIWIIMRSRAGALVLVVGLLMIAARSVVRIDPGFSLPEKFGADNRARLQHELQAWEADLARYVREHPGLSNKEIVSGFLSGYRRPNRFDFSDPTVPPLFIKVSHWRDEVPRVVVSFGCANSIVFDSTTMEIEQID